MGFAAWVVCALAALKRFVWISFCSPCFVANGFVAAGVGWLSRLGWPAAMVGLASGTVALLGRGFS